MYIPSMTTYLTRALAEAEIFAALASTARIGTPPKHRASGARAKRKWKVRKASGRV